MSCEDYYDEGEFSMKSGLDEYIKNTSKEKRITASIKICLDKIKKILGGK